MSALVLTEPGTRVCIDGERFVVKRGDAAARHIRVGEVSEMLLFGGIEITHRATTTCLKKSIDVVFFSAGGRFQGRLVGADPGNAALRVAQYRTSTDPESSAAFAKAIVRGKILNQRALLLRAQRTLRDPGITSALAHLRRLAIDVEQSKDVDAIRGFEGAAAASYFSTFPALIKNPVFSFTKRVARPPTDPMNAMLSFGYTLLGTIVESAVAAAGLDTGLGFLHVPSRARASLALDLLEEFRPVVVDTLVFRLVNRRQVAPTDFECPDDRATVEADALGLAELDPSATVGRAVYLSATGRNVFLPAFFARIRESLYYPPFDGSHSIRDIIQQQAHALARAIDGRASTYAPFENS